MAWEEDPLTTLKIVFQIGDPRKGKGDRKNFRRSLLWLYENHFETLLLNLDSIGQFSYHKNLLDLLILAMEGPGALDDNRQKRQNKNHSKRQKVHKRNVFQFYESKKDNEEVQKLASIIRTTITVGPSKNRVKEVQLPRSGLVVSAKPTNWQYSIWKDEFQVEVNGTALYVTRVDLNQGWDQDLELEVQYPYASEPIPEEYSDYRDGFQKRPNRKGHWESNELRQEFIEFMKKKDQEISTKARVTRKDRESDMLQRAEEKYRSDEKYRHLHDSVAKYFARGLEQDRKIMDEGKSNCFGGFAKWAPSPKGSHDRRTNICEGIINELYPDRYKYRDPDLRTHFFQHYLSSIRRAAQIPESFTGSGEWNLVNYSVMPSLCRQTYGDMYRRHDKERYDSFLNQAVEQAERGEKITMIKAGVLLPHEITARASRSDKALNNELGLQWLRLVQDVKDKGKLPNALSICDVSGSMTWGENLKTKPIDVSVALSMLVSDVTSGPFCNQVITFSQNPELVQLPKPTVDNLSSRASFMKGMNWNGNTDFQAVFELILGRAVAEKVTPDKMPSILFCFSDMEFDQAQGLGNWKTDLEIIRSKYAKSGYEVPTIVFWNLRDSGSKPASYEEPGVVMLSGFSAGMLKSFLEYRLDDIRAPTPLENMVEMLRFYDDLVLAPGDMVIEDGMEQTKPLEPSNDNSEQDDS